MTLIEILQLILAVIILVFLLTALIGAPYVPSKTSDIKKAFNDLYHVSRDDLVVDLGSGDGSVSRFVSKQGARSLGLEINPVLVLISRILSYGDKKVSFKLANYWGYHLPIETTVVYAFSVDRDVNRIGKWLQSESNRLNKKIKLISLGFNIENKVEDSKSGVYYLYTFAPLQMDKAQV